MKLLIRFATGLTILAVVLLLVWHPMFRQSFSFIIGALAAIGLYEYYALVRAREISPETIGGILSGTLVTVSAIFGNLTLTSFLLYGATLLVAALHMVRGQHSVAGLATSVFGVFYVGWFGAHFIFLRNDPTMGPGWVTVLLAAVVLTDTGAFFVGKVFGRHRMAPGISPNKTWEGSFGGIAATMVGMVVVYALNSMLDQPLFPLWTLAGYLFNGALLSIAAQVGDLAESCLKRDAGVKDSGGIFPGHGGMLDRCDGFLFAAPVLYYIAKPLNLAI